MLSLLKKIFLVIFLRHVDGFKGEHKQPEYLKLQAFFLSSCNFQHTIYLYIYVCVILRLIRKYSGFYFNYLFSICLMFVGCCLQPFGLLPVVEDGDYVLYG